MIETQRYDKGLGDAEIYSRIPYNGQFFNFSTLTWSDTETDDCRSFLRELPDVSTIEAWYFGTFPVPAGGPYTIQIVRLSTGEVIGNDLTTGGVAPDPGTEPITLDDVEGQCRIADLAAESTTINIFITAIRQKAEAITRRALVIQSRKTILDSFPCGREKIDLIMPPLISVESVKYYDADGVQQTLDPSAYRVVTDVEPGYIIPVYGTEWPSTLDDKGVVEISYTCGYSECPAAIKQFILLNVASLYEQRETIVTGTIVSDLVGRTLADSLLDDFRVIRF